MGLNITNTATNIALARVPACRIYAACPKGFRPAVLRLVNQALPFLIARFSVLRLPSG
jgi:hypothetical protein